MTTPMKLNIFQLKKTCFCFFCLHQVVSKRKDYKLKEPGNLCNSLRKMASQKEFDVVYSTLCDDTPVI